MANDAFNVNIALPNHNGDGDLSTPTISAASTDIDYPIPPSLDLRRFPIYGTVTKTAGAYSDYNVTVDPILKEDGTPPIGVQTTINYETSSGKWAGMIYVPAGMAGLYLLIPVRITYTGSTGTPKPHRIHCIRVRVGSSVAVGGTGGIKPAV